MKSDKVVEEVIKAEIDKEKKLGQFAAHEIPVHVFVLSALKRGIEIGKQEMIEAVEKLAFTKYDVGMYGCVNVKGKDWEALKKKAGD